MEITEIRIKLMSDPNERLQAFCSLTFDGSFVIRDLKIIQGTKGSFVAMPSRKLTDHCPRCSAKNHLRAQFCNECGVRLHQDRALKSDDGRAKLYADIAHPINSECREMIQEHVLIAYVSELERKRGNATLDLLDKLAAVLGVPLSEFFREPEAGAKKPKPLPSGRPPRSR